MRDHLEPAVRRSDGALNDGMELLVTLATGIALLGLFVVSETALHHGMPAELTRRLTHVVGASAGATFPLYLHQRDVLLLAAIFTGFLVRTWSGHTLQSVHAVPRVTVGALVFPVGLAIAALLSWSHPAAFALGALTLALADTAAGTFGRSSARIGWHVAGGRKSLRGSLAFLAVSFALALVFCLAFAEPRPTAAMTVAIVLTIIEGSLGYGLDNLPLPAVAALLGEALLGL